MFEVSFVEENLNNMDVASCITTMIVCCASATRSEATQLGVTHCIVLFPARLTFILPLWSGGAIEQFRKSFQCGLICERDYINL